MLVAGERCRIQTGDLPIKSRPPPINRYLELFSWNTFCGPRFYFGRNAQCLHVIQLVEINMNKTLLDEREVSTITGVPQKTLQYWRFAGASHAPKFIKLGKRVYYRKQDLDEWLAERPSYSSATQAKHQSTG